MVGSNLACNPLASVAKPVISNVAINPSTVEKISGEVRSELKQLGETGKKVLDTCEVVGGVEKCVKYGLKAVNLQAELG